MTHAFATSIKFALAFWLCMAGQLLAAPGQTTPFAERLYARQIETYVYLLRNRDVADSVKDKLRERFHVFALECWLAAKEEPANCPPKWRNLIRGMLHSEAKDVHYFNDPLSVLPLFRNGVLSGPVAAPPVTGLELDGLTEGGYKQMLQGFQLAYFDFNTTFASDAPPSDLFQLNQGNAPADQWSSITNTLSGKKWSWLRADRLPWDLRNNPFQAFATLPSKAKTYFLPAFLRMCEAEPEQMPDLWKRLLMFLSSDTSDAAEVRSQLNDRQKQCVTAFFSWFGHGPEVSVALDKFQRKLSH